jgi:hypothetical protein
LAASRAARPARIDQHRGGILATNALAAAPRPPPTLWAGDKGPAHAARGCRCWKDPEWLAASFDRNTPEQIMALVLGLTVCVLV